MCRTRIVKCARGENRRLPKAMDGSRAIKNLLWALFVIAVLIGLFFLIGLFYQYAFNYAVVAAFPNTAVPIDFWQALAFGAFWIFVGFFLTNYQPVNWISAFLPWNWGKADTVTKISSPAASLIPSGQLQQSQPATPGVRTVFAGQPTMVL